MLLTWLAIRELTKAKLAIAEAGNGAVEKVAQVCESQAQLLDKALALLSAKDPMAFQAVQAMNQTGLYTEPYDPSDEAEIEKMKAFGIIPADEEGDLDGHGSPDEEREWLRTHGVAGVDL